MIPQTVLYMIDKTTLHDIFRSRESFSERIFIFDGIFDQDRFDKIGFIVTDDDTIIICLTLLRHTYVSLSLCESKVKIMSLNKLQI